MKKFIALLLALVVIVSAFSISASAAYYVVQDTGAGNISATNGNLETEDGGSTKPVSYVSNWELYAYYDDGNAVIRFGFDNWVQNEDYVYTYHGSVSHHGSVKNNDVSEVKTPQTAKGKWSSKADIEHAAKPVWKLYY